MSGYLTSTSFVRVDGLSTNPRVMGCYKNLIKLCFALRVCLVHGKYEGTYEGKTKV